MFSWRTKINLDPFFRAAYVMQFIAAAAMLAGLFLPWWEGEVAHNAFDLLNRSFSKLRERDPVVIGEPLVVLWLLWPLLVVSLLRGFTGFLVVPVAFRWLALVAWIPALLALAHFYINFGDSDAAREVLAGGTIQPGFWLTCSSTVLLGLLILTEFLIKPAEDEFLAQRTQHEGPVNDPHRLWQGDYVTCPHCGMLNEPLARRCYNCKNLLFRFEEE